MRVSLLALSACVAIAQSEKYTGPRPPKPDVPYLLHANKLVELDAATAQQADRKDDTVFTISGTASKAQTPLPEPIFVIAAEKIVPDKLDMYRMNVAKGGARELAIPKNPKKGSPRAVRMTASKLDGNLYKLEVQEFMENGEYCMSPQGSNAVFCFAVY
jgi:hypothetical protein